MKRAAYFRVKLGRRRGVIPSSKQSAPNPNRVEDDHVDDEEEQKAGTAKVAVEPGGGLWPVEGDHANHDHEDAHSAATALDDIFDTDGWHERQRDIGKDRCK
jgi:hypothetical protein